MIKIIVSSEEEKEELLNGSEHIHDLHDLDTDIPGANFLSHLYMAPHLIEVKPENNGYEDWEKKEIALAGLKSGDIGAIELAFQLAGIAPCPKCGYVKNHCKCEKVE